MSKIAEAIKDPISPARVLNVGNIMWNMVNVETGTKNKTRIAGLNFSNKRPIKGEEVITAGYLQSYNEKEKKWIPVEKKNVEVYVNGVKAGNSKTDHNGYFCFECSFKDLGDHNLEFRFGGSRRLAKTGVSSSLSVITEKQKRDVEKIAKIVLAAIVLVIVIAIVALYVAKTH